MRREILINGPKPEQHVPGYVEHIVLLVFRQNEPQDTVWCKRRAWMRNDVLRQFLRRNTRLFTKLYRRSIGRTVNGKQAQLLSQTTQTRIREQSIQRQR